MADGEVLVRCTSQRSHGHMVLSRQLSRSSFDKLPMESRLHTLESQQIAILARLADVESGRGRSSTINKRHSNEIRTFVPESEDAHRFLIFRVILFMLAIACMIPFEVATVTKLPSVMQIALVSYPLSLTCTLMLSFVSLEVPGTPYLVACSWVLNAVVLAHDAFVSHPFGSEGNVLDALTAIIQGMWTAFQFHILMHARRKLVIAFGENLHGQAVIFFKRGLLIGFGQFAVMAPVLACENTKISKAPTGISLDDAWLTNTCILQNMPNFFLAQAGSQSFVFMAVMVDLGGLTASRVLSLSLGGWVFASTLAFGCYLCSVLFLFMAGHQVIGETVPHMREVLQCAMYFQSLFWVCGYCASHNVVDMMLPEHDEDDVFPVTRRVSL